MQRAEMIYEAELKEDRQFEITYSEVSAPPCEEVALSSLTDGQNQFNLESAGDMVSYHQMTK